MSIGCGELFVKYFFNHEKDERNEKERGDLTANHANHANLRESSRMKTGQDNGMKWIDRMKSSRLNLVDLRQSCDPVQSSFA